MPRTFRSCHFSSLGEQTGRTNSSTRAWSQQMHINLLERHRAERTRELAIMREMLNMLNSSQSVEAILDFLIGQASDLLAAQAAALLRMQPQDDHLVVQALRGLPMEYTRAPVGLGEGIIGRAVRDGVPVAAPDFSEWLRNEAESTPKPPLYMLPVARQYGAALVIPLRARDQTYGGLVLYYEQRRMFSREDLQLATALADLATLALENARIRDEAGKIAADAERQRLVHELHDTVTQMLFSAGLLAEILPRLFAEDAAEGVKRLEELRRLTRGALAEMRTLLIELRPVAMLETPFGDLLRPVVEAAMGCSRLQVRLDVQGNVVLTPDAQTNFYRIVRESLDNVVRHARAQHLIVKLDYSSEFVDLLIHIDGRGFDPAALASDHIGPQIMRERAAAVGSQVSIISQPQQGTCVRVNWRANAIE